MTNNTPQVDAQIEAYQRRLDKIIEEFRVSITSLARRSAARASLNYRLSIASADQRMLRFPPTIWANCKRRNKAEGKKFAFFARGIKNNDITILDRWGDAQWHILSSPSPLRDLRDARDRARGLWATEWQSLPLNTTGLGVSPDALHAIFAILARHYAHVSVEDPQKVAYYPTLRDLMRGREVRTTMGRMLTRLVGPDSANPLLTELQIKTLAERYVARQVPLGEVLFIENTDPDGWEEIYNNGPHSCMQGESCVRVYARPGNGLRLAYAVNEDGDPIARAIVREDTDPPQFVRVYPNPDTDELTAVHTQFKARLQALGYVHGNLNGIKLAYEECDEGIVAPYIDTGVDGTQSASIGYDSQGAYLLIERSGDLELDTTAGYVSLGVECEECGDRYDPDDGTYSEYHHMSICPYCVDHSFALAYVSRYEQDYVRADEVIYCESDGEHYAEREANNLDIYQCEASGYWYHIDDLIVCDAGRYEGDFIHYELVEQDHLTEERAHHDDMTETDDGWVLDGNLEVCEITGNERHYNYLLEITGLPQGRRTIFVDLENVSPEEFFKHFVVSGKEGEPRMIVPRGYYGTDITENEVTYAPTNIKEGEDLPVSFQEFLEGWFAERNEQPQVLAAVA